MEWSILIIEIYYSAKGRGEPVTKIMNMSKKTWKDIGFVAALVSIPILQFLIFYVFINGNVILLAFQKENNAFTFDNFHFLFRYFGSSNSTLLEALVNTLKFFALQIVMFPVSLLFSYFLYKKIFLHRYLQIVFFLPSIISAMVMVTLFKNIMNGPVAEIWATIFGLQNQPLFFDSTRYALKSIMVYMVWTGLANNMVIFSGTMARVPAEILESGKMDGVGFWRELVQLVVPLIWPTLSTLILLQFIGIFTASGPILLFTQGKWGTYTISYWIYEYTVVMNNYNYASAAGLFFTVIGLPVIYVAKYFLNKLDKNVEY